MANDSRCSIDRRSVVKGGALAGAGLMTGLAGCIGGEDDGNGGGGGGGDYPSQAIDMIIVFGAGGGTDTNARQVQPYYEEELGTDLVAENREGASGRIGSDYVYNSDPDGYTIGINGADILVLGETLFDPDYSTGDMTHIGTTFNLYNGLFVESGRWDSIDDLVDESPDDLVVGTSGVATNNDFAAVMFLEELGLENYQIVEMGSGNEAAQSAAAETDIGVGNVSPTTAGFVDEGIVDCLLINQLEGENVLLPDVPTIGEYDDSMTQVDYSPSFFGPPEIPDDRTQALQDGLEAALQNPELVEWRDEQGFAESGLIGDDMLAYIEDLETAAETYADVREVE